MAQERDGRYAGAVNGVGDETARLRAEIEYTRDHMSGTIGELQERLRPEVLVQQAKDAARGAVEKKVENMMNTASETAHRAADRARASAGDLAHQVKSHPVPAACVAAGLAWWMGRDRNGVGNGSAVMVPAALAAGALGYYMLSQRVFDEQGRLAVDKDDLRAAGESVKDGVRQLGETAEEYARSAKATAEDYGRRAQATAGEYAGQVGDQVRDQVRHMGDSARARMDETTLKLRERKDAVTHTMEGWMDANPLAIGAVALALGVAAGLSVPGTEAERQVASSVMT